MDRQSLPAHPFAFPFLTATPDLFTLTPVTTYDPSALFIPMEVFGVVSVDDVKKEEATEPGYIVQEISLPARPDAIKLRRKGIQKQAKLQCDGDYTPHESQKLPKRPQIKQKQDRNLIPNTVHQLLSFVQQQFKSRYLADRILRRLNPRPEAYTLARYYNFHRMLRGGVNSYVNEAAMRNITQEGALDYGEYGREEQRFYCLVSRVMVRHFLRTESVLLILRSRKVRRENILQHLSVQRFLYENMICEQF